jgi:hypothetical protein
MHEICFLVETNALWFRPRFVADPELVGLGYKKIGRMKEIPHAATAA